MVTIEYIDDYSQRYITTMNSVTLGTEFITEIYTPYVAGKELEIRRSKDSIEIFGTITVITQVFDADKTLIAYGMNIEYDWVEVWKRCWEKPTNRFKYLMDNQVVDYSDYQVNSGPAFVSPDSSNDSIWPDLNPDGSVIPSGSTNLVFIDVWN